MEQKKYTYVGTSVLRNDGLEKAVGEMKYTGDCEMPGMLYAFLVTSEHAHAEVTAIDTAEALRVPGVVRIYTASDVPDTLYSAHNWLMDMADIADEPLLTARPKHYGDRIGFVVAESYEAARIAAGRIRITYAPLPVVIDIDTALNPAALGIHDYGNVPFDLIKEYGD